MRAQFSKINIGCGCINIARRCPASFTFLQPKFAAQFDLLRQRRRWSSDEAELMPAQAFFDLYADIDEMQRCPWREFVSPDQCRALDLNARLFQQPFDQPAIVLGFDRGIKWTPSEIKEPVRSAGESQFRSDKAHVGKADLSNQ